MTIFFFSDISYEGLYQRPQHLAKRFARENRVIWIEPIILTKKPAFKPIEICSNIFSISLPAFPYNARQKWVKSLTSILSKFSLFRWVLLKIQVLLLKNTMESFPDINDNYIFFYNNFHFIKLIQSFNPKKVCFDYIDNAFGFVDLPRHMVEDWKFTINKSNLITVTSHTLKKQVEEFRKDNIHLVSNGVEYNLFADKSKSESLTDLPKKQNIVGYIGAVYKWFDFDLLNYLCKELPDIDFVIIGREHPDVKSEIQQLNKNFNFHFLGFREYHKIPQYLNSFKAAIIPFKSNILTSAVNPVKLYEYSAVGLPTVTTNFSDDLDEFKELIFIADTKETFQTMLKRAITKYEVGDYKRRLRDFAKANDWDKKFQKINSLIQNN